MGGRDANVVIDWSVLREVVGSNDAMRQRLLTSFAVESEQDLCALEAALDAQKFGAARSVAHQLRGAASTVGALSLARLARHLESPEIYADETRVDELRRALREQVAEVLDHIHAMQPS